MTKNITLTNLVIKQIYLNYMSEVVEVFYDMIDADGLVWETGSAKFWVTLPPPLIDQEGNPMPLPDNWFQLPSSYFPTLLQLRSDADDVLTAKFLV